MFSLTPVVRGLLLANVVIFALQSLMHLPFIEWFGMRYFLSEAFAPYQIVTHMFIHASFMHLLSNMLGLFVFGRMLEHFWGPQRFLLFYMICGVGAGLLYSGVNFYEIFTLKMATDAYIASPGPEALMAFFRDYEPALYRLNIEFINHYSEFPTNMELENESIRVVKEIFNRQANMPMVGASGAVFGILMAFGLLFPNTEFFLLFPPIPVKAKYLVTFYGVYAFFGAIQNMPGDNVAHYAHLGGMLIAFILIKFVWRQNRNHFY